MPGTYININRNFGLVSIPALLDMIFPDAVFQFFPLKVNNISNLQKILDARINFTNDQNGQPACFFQAAAPFILLQIVNYRRVLFEENQTYLTQREVMFSIPVEWYSPDANKNQRFNDWGLITPFIYLDNPISIWLGREVYGWPKTQIIVRDLAAYHDPAQPRPLFKADLPVFPPTNPLAYPDATKPFLEIYQNPQAVPWSQPRVTDALSAVPRLIAGAFSTASSFFKSWADMLGPDSGDLRSVDAVRRMLQKGFGYVNDLWPSADWMPQLFVRQRGQGKYQGSYTQSNAAGGASSPFMKNQISLKQFPDAKDPALACYQAIVRSSVNFEQVNDAGLLFDPLAGDSSGGISIRLYEKSGESVVRDLGLELSGKGSDQNGHEYSLARPLFPFWWNLTLDYGSANNLSWRQRAGSWLQPAAPGSDLAPSPNKPNQYVKNYASGQDLEVAEPFAKKSPVTIRVLPLLATKGKLADQCRLLNKQNYRFDPIKACDDQYYALIMVAQFEAMVADDKENRWADNEVIVAIPAMMTGKNGIALAVLLPMVNFVGTEWNAITDREIYGRMSLQSQFVGSFVDPISRLPPPSVVPPTGKSSPGLELFKVMSDFCPDIDERHGMLYDVIRVNQIIEDEHTAGEDNEDDGNGKNGNEDGLKEWLRGLGFADMVADPRQFHSVALKQIADATSLIKKDNEVNAAYQSLVSVERRFDAAVKIDWIDEDLTVAIDEYKAITIKQALGLDGKKQSDPGKFQSLRSLGSWLMTVHKPFYISGLMKAGSVETLWEAWYPK